MTPTRLGDRGLPTPEQGREPDVGATVGGDELHALVRRIGHKVPGHRQQGFVGRGHVIEIAVRPQEGKQALHVRFVGDGGDLHGWRIIPEAGICGA